ncbi:MAG: VOC family protein [Rhodospirillaceae bacterium]|nr:VOC family protein [Rhodospirillaceae bacterium]
MKILHLDHLVLTVVDLDVSCDFYARVLGMEPVTFDVGGVTRRALSFGKQKINLHESGNEFTPRAAMAIPGSSDLCLITESTIEDIIDHLKSAAVDILQGPVARTGAEGPMMSVYFRDPDGNLLEVSRYDN